MTYYKLVKSTEAKAFEGNYITVVDRGINGKGSPNPNTLPFFSFLPNLQTPGHENTGDCRRANKKIEFKVCCLLTLSTSVLNQFLKDIFP